MNNTTTKENRMTNAELHTKIVEARIAANAVPTHPESVPETLINEKTDGYFDCDDLESDAI